MPVKNNEFSREEEISWKNRGNSMAKQGDYGAAISCYNSGLKINPYNLDLLHNKSVVLKKLGRYDEAIDCEDLIAKIKENPHVVDETPTVVQPPEVLTQQTEIKTESPFNPLKIFDKIGGAVKQGTRKVAYSILLRKHNLHIKKLIVTQFDSHEIQKMCAYFNIGSPHPTRTNSRGERYSITPTYNHWVEHVMDKIGYATVRDYAKRKSKIPHDVIELEKNYKKERAWKYPEYEQVDDKPGSPDTSARSDDKLLQEIIYVIKEFRPIKRFNSEELYHTNLFTYLSERIPVEVAFEEQRGRSRPDIVVGDIAIEVKGPTDTQGLQTIADKMLRYPQHFDYIIVVLFDVNVYEPMYQEWYEGIMRHYEGKLTIIRTDEIAAGKSS